MKANELAELLNGRPFFSEITDDEIKQAKSNGLVVALGNREEEIRFKGAINRSFSCHGGITCDLNEEGLLENNCCERCPNFELIKDKSKTIDTVFDNDRRFWTYKTNIPHHTFEIFQDGVKYCNGIVFCLNNLNKKD